MGWDVYLMSVGPVPSWLPPGQCGGHPWALVGRETCLGELESGIKDFSEPVQLAIRSAHVTHFDSVSGG